MYEDDKHAAEGINAISKTVCIFGGIDNRMPSSSFDSAPAITIEGFIMFGGLSIKLKRTLKDRLKDFANTVKNVIG